MRTATLAALLSLSMASAAPLLGTTGSFATTEFCRVYGCELTGKDVLGPGLSEWRYTVRGQFPVDMNTAPEVITIIRQNNRIISANWVTGAQDGVLYPNGYNTKMIAQLVGTLTGKAPSQEVLGQLNEGCGPKKPVKTVPWNGAARLSCLQTPEFANAWRFSFHVHLP
ncbi:hypothetical protein [Deinococcus enclensis]|uniref:Uncharacterized protein n=1 Tax=Deinococcus enclensis TaxID=1049582 RepID=A0ABT9MGV1_9DEIO|nr:hypothetical protein [Deinococcus enclensis]MDP9765434.1 hypothetical protein [Deinococcus enclensis]